MAVKASGCRSSSSRSAILNSRNMATGDLTKMSGDWTLSRPPTTVKPGWSARVRFISPDWIRLDSRASGLARCSSSLAQKARVRAPTSLAVMK